MKTLTLTILAFLLGFSVSNAQDSKFGIKGGINLATYKFNVGGFTITPDRAIKPRIGFFYEKPIDDKWAFQLEALYNSTGYKPESGSGIDKISINYLAFPLIFKYYVSEKFNFHGGLEPAFFIGGKADDLELDDSVKSLDLGMGLGAEVSLGEKTALSGRYTFGLTNTDDSGISGLSQKPNNIELALLFGF